MGLLSAGNSAPQSLVEDSTWIEELLKTLNETYERTLQGWKIEGKERRGRSQCQTTTLLPQNAYPWAYPGGYVLGGSRLYCNVNGTTQTGYSGTFWTRSSQQGHLEMLCGGTSGVKARDREANRHQKC